MKTEYIVTSFQGMTPFARTTLKKMAVRASRLARKLGFAGEIVRYVEGKRQS